MTKEEINKLADGYYAGSEWESSSDEINTKRAWVTGFRYAELHLFAHLTTENQRLREALEGSKRYIDFVLATSSDINLLSPARVELSQIAQALKPDNSK